MSEETVVRQCAPTLAGIKTGSLFPCPYDSREELLQDVRSLNKRLVPKGLCLLPMRYQGNRALLYLYRPHCLRRDLTNDLTPEKGAVQLCARTAPFVVGEAPNP